MNVQVIQVPYDSGHADTRTGQGPGCFIEKGLAGRLEEKGHDVYVERVVSKVSLPTEIGTFFDVNRQLAEHVRAAAGRKRFPLILAGNCNSCVGTIAGLDAERLGIIWFDAHGDFNTPETTLTGFLDGMGLAMATGRCWTSLLKSIPGFRPVADRAIVHVGARDLDVAEREMLEAAEIPLVTAQPQEESKLYGHLEAAIRALNQHVDGIYLHLDMDVLESTMGKPNHLAVAGGLSPAVVATAIGMIKSRLAIKACTIASFDPSLDRDHTILKDGMGLITALLD